MKNEQENLPMPDKQDLAAPAVEDTTPTRTQKAAVSEDGNCKACRTFSYLCPICNPR